MKLVPAIERSVLQGALAVEPWDPLRDCRIQDLCVVSALRPSGALVATAVRHSTGVHGFLKLGTGTYHLRTIPLVPGYLPSLRSVTLPLPALPWLDVTLRSSSAYVGAGYGLAVLRGTLHWGPVPAGPIRMALPPVRWATVYASVESADAPGVVFDVGWTRSSPQGEFALFLHVAPPHDDGLSAVCTAHLEIRADTPTSLTPRAEDDYSDLPLDDGDDAAIRSAMPLRFSLDVLVAAGDDRTVNQHVYNVTASGSAPVARQNVIVIT